MPVSAACGGFTCDVASAVSFNIAGALLTNFGNVNCLIAVGGGGDDDAGGSFDFMNSLPVDSHQFTPSHNNTALCAPTGG